ncbi:flagellar basal body rod protein FlgB [Ammoniphilus oxalaticus]|nr:flagellar basal body rod protein FlgB [Ammoniphilus oxalaticus]
MSLTVLNLLGRGLDASALRQQTISNNIANAETPHYQSQRVVFEETLQAALNSSGVGSFQGKRTDPRHIEIGMTTQLPTPTIREVKTIQNNNENGVDLDYEMTSLARNSVWYNAIAQQMNHEFNQLKTVIKGRG